MTRLCRMVSVGILAAAAAVAAAGQLKPDLPGQGNRRDEPIFPFSIHERTLDNGLRLVTIPYDSPGLVSFYLVVRTGSRDEVDAGHSGFAHFFEHMMFRGTERYSQEKYNNVLKRMGVEANASTSDDRTTYYMTGPAAGFETMVELEADRFLNLKYSEEGFRTEALAVLGEYNKSASSPFLALEEKLRELAFTIHPYRHTTLGFLADIKAMPQYYEYSLEFFRRFYRPDNVIALVVGDVTAERAFGTIAKHFGGWTGRHVPAQISAEPSQKGRRSAHMDWANPTRPYLSVGYHTPAFSAATVQSPALDAISALLFSDAAPLYQQLVLKDQWVDFITGGAEDHRDPYLFEITTRPKTDDLVPKVKAAVDDHLDRLRRQPVDPSRLERIKSHLRYSFAVSLDTPDAVAARVSHYLALAGSVGTINELFRRYQELTPADIQRVAQETFRPGNETQVTLSHRKVQPPAAAEVER